MAGANNIIVFFDNDPAGRAHADAVILCSLRITKRVCRLDLKDVWPDIGQGNDVSDWLVNCGTPERLLELIVAATSKSEIEAAANKAATLKKRLTKLKPWALGTAWRTAQ